MNAFEHSLRNAQRDVACPELGMYIDFGPTRRVNYLIARYSDLAEFRAMLEGWSAKGSWNGKHFLTTLSKEKGPTFTLWLRQNDVSIDFTETEWNALRELFQKAGMYALNARVHWSMDKWNAESASSAC